MTDARVMHCFNNMCIYSWTGKDINYPPNSLAVVLVTLKNFLRFLWTFK